MLEACELLLEGPRVLLWPRHILTGRLVDAWEWGFGIFKIQKQLNHDNKFTINRRTEKSQKGKVHQLTLKGWSTQLLEGLIS